MMKENDEKYLAYIRILEEELLPAMGCTEPIALAYAGAKAREVLGEIPDKVLVEASGSIIKNVKSVVVPNTNGLKGISSAVTAGIIAGEANKQLEVISKVSKEEINSMQKFIDNTDIKVEHIDNGVTFEMIVTLFKGESYTKVHISDYHTNIILIEKDGNIVFEKEIEVKKDDTLVRTDRSILNMKSIWEFINIVNVDDIKKVLQQQIDYNYAIAEEGLKGDYGANIGSVILNTYGDSLKIRARAKAAAGSDARMNGCELPVVINSGSGNQGMTCSIPVIEFAKDLKSSEEQLLRALALSNLTAIHQKTGIGTLSAYCGVVSAGIAAGAGIIYLMGDGFDEIEHTIINALGIISGVICDGAKASCAAKIASSLDAAFLGYDMYKNGQMFHGGDGIIVDDVEGTIANIGRICQNGMCHTNEEIIKIMTE